MFPVAPVSAHIGPPAGADGLEDKTEGKHWQVETQCSSDVGTS